VHNWKDRSFDWKQLDESIEMVSSFMRFWGRIGVNSKEKFGTARIYTLFWDGSLHGLIYPGYYSCQFPKWLWKLDCGFISPLVRWTRLPKLAHWYQRKIYSMAYSKGLKHFPAMKVELVIAADFDELIKERPAIMKMYRFRIFVRKLLQKNQEEDEE